MRIAASMNLPRPFGPYELVRQLAVGGMAEVFVARARSVAGFEKVVALKMIHPRFSADPEFARLLVEEANITAQLSHRNIVQVIDLGQIDGTHYIAMEYVDGPDLSRVISRLRDKGRRVSPRVAAFVLREVCDGLDHAHRKAGPDGRPLRIVHRDVSPPNILISSSGEVKLTDFGIAKAALRASSTEAGVVKGKYGYMAPEQSRGEQVDLRADLFSAGCVLYELFTGRPVYPEMPLPQLLTRVAKGQYEPPERLRGDLPAPLGAIIRKALASQPEQRFPTARAMADELNAFLYTLPPGPEMELLALMGELFDTTGDAVLPNEGPGAFDPEEDDSTQIESMASLRKKMEQVPGSGAAMAALMMPAGAKGAAERDEFTDVPTRAQGRKRTTSVAPPSTHLPSTAAPGRRSFAEDDEESTRAGRPLGRVRANTKDPMPVAKLGPPAPPPAPTRGATKAPPPPAPTAPQGAGMRGSRANLEPPRAKNASGPMGAPAQQRAASFEPSAAYESSPGGAQPSGAYSGGFSAPGAGDPFGAADAQPAGVASDPFAPPPAPEGSPAAVPAAPQGGGLLAPQHRAVLLAGAFAGLGVLVLLGVLLFGR